MSNLALFPPAFKGVPRGGASGPTTFAGTLPATVAELNGWTQASIWTVAHNLKDVAGSPNTCAAMTGSTSFELSRYPSTGVDVDIIAAPQSNYADQDGVSVSLATKLLYRGGSANWSINSTVPTVFLCTFKFDAAPTQLGYFFNGLDGGAVSGWTVQAHPTSGIRFQIGNGSALVSGSYIGGTALYDGEWHTLALCIDDAGGKAKLICESYSTESTGMTIVPGTSIYTLGALWSGDTTFCGPIDFLLTARGEHPLAYTNFSTALDSFEDAWINNTQPDAIASLPTSLTELNDATGLVFTHAWNLSSVSSNPPITGASGANLAPYTGTLVVGGAGTAPTLLSAPQGRTSFTSQSGILLDSANDNLYGSDLWTGLDMTAMIVFKSTDVAGSAIAHKTDYTATKAGWLVYLSGGSLTLQCYNSFSTSITRSYTPPSGYTTNYNLLSFRVPGASGQYSRAKMGGSAGSSSASTYGTPAAESSAIAVIGANKDAATRNTSVLFVARLAGQTADATLDAAHDAFRWRYGL